MTFLPFVILWVLMALSVLALLVWRQSVARHEDDKLHVLDGAFLQKSAEQMAVAAKLDFIDKWGKMLTIVTVVYGVILGVAYAWASWIHNTSVGV